MPLPNLRNLRRFAGYLGWDNLQKHKHRVPLDDATRIGMIDRNIIWYDAGPFPSLFLQINIMSRPHIAVYAPRFALNSGWHRFKIFDTVAQQRREAQRLEEWLHFKWFASPDARSQYRKLHPECVGYTWKRIQTVGVPIPNTKHAYYRKRIEHGRLSHREIVRDWGRQLAGTSLASGCCENEWRLLQVMRRFTFRGAQGDTHAERTPSSARTASRFGRGLAQSHSGRR